MTSATPPLPPPAEPSDASGGGAPGGRPSAGTGTRPQLRRSGSDRIVGGVSGGLADYSGIDVLVWRIAFVALTLAGGSGVLIYLLLWLVMPSEPLAPGRTPSIADDVVDRLQAALYRALGRRG